MRDETKLCVILFINEPRKKPESEPLTSFSSSSPLLFEYFWRIPAMKPAIVSRSESAPTVEPTILSWTEIDLQSQKKRLLIWMAFFEVENSIKCVSGVYTGHVPSSLRGKKIRHFQPKKHSWNQPLGWNKIYPMARIYIPLKIFLNDTNAICRNQIALCNCIIQFEKRYQSVDFKSFLK